MDWRTLWRAHKPDAPLKYPFRTEDRKATSHDGELVFFTKKPAHNVVQMLEEATRMGAVPVAQWSNPTGLTVAVAIPGDNKVWFMIDDHENGRYISLAGQMFYGVLFADNATILRGNVEWAAQLILGQGLKRHTKEHIATIMELDPPFPINSHSKRAWGNIRPAVGKNLRGGLTTLQEMNKMSITSAMAATKTVKLLVPGETI